MISLGYSQKPQILTGTISAVICLVLILTGHYLQKSRGKSL